MESFRKALMVYISLNLELIWRNGEIKTLEQRGSERGEWGVGRGYSSLWILHGIIPQSERLALKMSGLVTEKRLILRGRWGSFRQPRLWLHAAATVDGNYRAQERSQCQSDFMWELEVELERCGGGDKDLKLCWGISCISYVCATRAIIAGNLK